MTAILSAADLWSDVIAVRQRSPLVHCITNLVAMNLNANVLLAAGASPVMAHAHEEVAEMAGLADAQVLNIGTLEPYWVESMHLALQAQKERATPVILDPVVAGATRYRDACIQGQQIGLVRQAANDPDHLLDTFGACLEFLHVLGCLPGGIRDIADLVNRIGNHRHTGQGQLA